MNLMTVGKIMPRRPQQPSKIMIVDDDADLCRALGLRLRANHYETLSTGDGYSALALAQKERPDLVLLDLGLPGFATGAAVLKHMRAFPSLAPIPVIVLTGQDARDYEERMCELGAAACFQKPVDDEELLAVICDCLQPNKKEEGSLAIPFCRSTKISMSRRRTRH
jgi:two-component system, OmpR family, KDP operon response regulator KdpE